MAQQRRAQRFNDLAEAVLGGTADDVRRMTADGTHPDDRDEINDPTPLMIAAARGQRDVVEVLVSAGADVNALAEDFTGELDQFPFLDDLFAESRLTAMTALAYAALYGQEQVFHYLAPRTAPSLRQEAEALRQAKAAHPDVVPRPYLEPKKPKSAREADRAKLLASSAAARKWVVQCPLCQKQGYKPGMPDEIDRRGTAAQIRKLFQPLILEAESDAENPGKASGATGCESPPTGRGAVAEAVGRNAPRGETRARLSEKCQCPSSSLWLVFRAPGNPRRRSVS